MSKHSQNANANDLKNNAKEATNLKLNLDLRYSLKEFEEINEWLKTNDVEIDDKSKKRPTFDGPIGSFEYEDGYLVPMPQTPIEKEAVVLKIGSLLERWNVQTRQDGVVTSSQGGFNFGSEREKEIKAPDVAFTPRETYRRLTVQQRRTFKGRPFHPTFVVEVEDVSRKTKLDELVEKFKETYLPAGVELGWLVDPINKTIYSFKKDKNGKIRRYNHKWRDVSGGDVLPGFVLKTSKIDKAIKKPTASKRTADSKRRDCPDCGKTFTGWHDFLEHCEDVHAS